MSRFFMKVPEAALLAVIAFSIIYYVLTTAILCLWRKRKEPTAPNRGTLPPVTLLRPVKRGVTQLAEKLRCLVASARPGDQIIVGVDDEESLAIARQIEGIEVVRCVRGLLLNPKVNKLAQMSPRARNAHWIISDSEALVSREFLDELRAEWQAGDVVTAGYCFHGAQSFPELLDHSSALLSLWPGLMLAPRRFTLGACTGFTQQDLEAVGGWEALANYLAEDNRLGALFSQAGRQIIFSRAVLPLDSDRLTFGGYLRHQLRVAVTYRISTPAGYFGMVLTHGITAALLLALVTLSANWALLLFLAVWLLRTATATINARLLGFPMANLALLTLLHSLTESACWVASWFSDRVQWSGSSLQLKPGGMIEPFGKAPMSAVPTGPEAVSTSR